MDKTTKLVLLSAVVVAVVIGSSVLGFLFYYRPGSGTLESGTTVNIREYSFSPRTLRVSVGSTVTWINMDNDAHSVQSGTANQPTTLFQSSLLNKGQSFNDTFVTPGSFAYHCGPHPFMTATILVE